MHKQPLKQQQFWDEMTGSGKLNPSATLTAVLLFCIGRHTSSSAAMLFCFFSFYLTFILPGQTR